MNFKKIFTDAKYTTIRQLIAISSTFLLIPVITKFVGEDAYGIWVTVLSVVTIFVAVGGIHMHGSLIRYLPRGDKKTVFSSTFSIVVVSSVISSLIFVGLEFEFSLISHSFGDKSELGIACIGGLIFISTLFTYLSNYPRARSDIKQHEIIKISRHTLYITVIPLIIFLTESIITGILAFALILLTITLSILIYYYPDWIHTPDVSEFDKYLNYSLPMIPKALSGTIFSHADKYLITILLSPSLTAAYAVTYSFCSLFRTLTSVLNPTLYPSVAQAWENGEFGELSQLYNLIFQSYLLIAIPALAGLIMISRPLLTIISTSDIAVTGSRILPLLGVGFLIWGIENPLTYILTAAEETDKLAKITVTTAILNILLNIVLLVNIGVIGAVIATTVSQSIKTFYIYIVGRQKVNIRFPLKEAAIYTLSTIVMTIFIYIFITGLEGVYFIASAVACGIPIYFISAYYLGGIDKEVYKVIN